MINFLLLWSVSAQNAVYSPEQVHIAWTDDDHSMSVTWASRFPSYGASVQFTPVPSHTSNITHYEFSSPGTYMSARLL